MSYRNYIYSFSEDYYNSLKKLNKQEVINKFEPSLDFFSVTFIEPDLGTLAEFGDYGLKFPKEWIKDFFENQDEFDIEGDFHVIKDIKQFLKHIIEEFQKNTAKFYDNKLKEIEEDEDYAAHSIKQFLSWRKIVWESGVVDLRDNNSMTNSGILEYAIFELLHIYKTYDFENKVFVYVGY